MKILHISAECFPVAKVGGLADVVGALPKYQNKLGVKSEVIMPFYDNAYTQKHNFKIVYKSSLRLGRSEIEFNILSPVKNDLGFKLHLVHIPGLLFKNYVYSSDDTHRFLAFQIAVLDWILQLKDKPTLLHCHDHHTGLTPFMVANSHKYKAFKNTPTLLTIHNAQYQGWFSHDLVGLIPEFDFSKVGLIDWNHMVNPLAAAIKCAWRITTVSPSYMEELKHRANGLESLISYESSKCVGILNGIDVNVWDPASDENLIKNFTNKTLHAGKAANKKYLCEHFSLDPEKPLFVFIGRLVGEKGADLFPEIFDIALRRNELSILLLGSGEKITERRLELLKHKRPINYNTFIGYDERLSHIMYAGADFLLMPSRVEPCGLNQMYALRYGTIPVVNNIGGLKDTVTDISNEGFGIVHYEASIAEVCNAISRAVFFYNKPKEFKKIRTLIMQIDHSWDVSANSYIELYKSLKK